MPVRLAATIGWRSAPSARGIAETIAAADHVLAGNAPAAAPLLGILGLATAYPALAGQAARPLHRAALINLDRWITEGIDPPHAD